MFYRYRSHDRPPNTDFEELLKWADEIAKLKSVPMQIIRLMPGGPEISGRESAFGRNICLWKAEGLRLCEMILAE